MSSEKIVDMVVGVVRDGANAERLDDVVSRKQLKVSLCANATWDPDAVERAIETALEAGRIERVRDDGNPGFVLGDKR